MNNITLKERKKKMNELIDKVLKQMQRDFDAQDITAVEELLTFVPIKYLQGYLPEGEEDESVS